MNCLNCYLLVCYYNILTISERGNVCRCTSSPWCFIIKFSTRSARNKWQAHMGENQFCWNFSGLEISIDLLWEEYTQWSPMKCLDKGNDSSLIKYEGWQYIVFVLPIEQRVRMYSTDLFSTWERRYQNRISHCIIPFRHNYTGCMCGASFCGPFSTWKPRSNHFIGVASSTIMIILTEVWGWSQVLFWHFFCSDSDHLGKCYATFSTSHQGVYSPACTIDLLQKYDVHIVFLDYKSMFW